MNRQIISTAQCIAVSYQNGNGFGRHRATLGEEKVEAALKVHPRQLCP